MTTITAEALKSMSAAEMLTLVNKLAAERDAAKAAQAKSNRLHCKVSEKGALSVYGLQRFPVTFYAGQWERLIAFVPDIQEFLNANKDSFATKP